MHLPESVINLGRLATRTRPTRSNSWQGFFRYLWELSLSYSGSRGAHFTRPSCVGPGQTTSPCPSGWEGLFLLWWELGSYSRGYRTYGIVSCTQMSTRIKMSGYATYQALTSPRVDVRKALALDSTQIGECVYLKTDRFPKIHGFTKAITRFLSRRN
jgi:hypothetical protein